MSDLYSSAIEGWEARLNRRDRARFVRAFEWGWEWLGTTPMNGLPPGGSLPPVEAGFAALQSWNRRVLADSDSFFAYPAVRQYRLDAARGGQPARLRFTSPVPLPQGSDEQYRLASAAWFPAAGQRAVVVLPQWNADAGGHMGLCGLLQRAGIAALRLSLPYHDHRRPGHLQRAEYTVDSNLGRTIHAARQAVCELRACLDWLESQGYDRLGVLGTSLGSCYGLLAAAHDRRLRANVFNHISMNFGDVVWTGLATRHVRDSMAPEVNQDMLRAAWAVISPASYIERYAQFGGGDAKQSLLIWGRYDPCFLPVYSRQVLEAFKRLRLPAEVWCLPCGHYTIGRPPFSWLDGFAMTRFLRREL